MLQIKLLSAQSKLSRLISDLKFLTPLKHFKLLKADTCHMHSCCQPSVSYQVHLHQLKFVL
jgi:hypothetical protein